MVKMKLTTTQRRTASIVALALAAILGLDLLYQVTMHMVWRHWLPTSLAAAVATTQPAATQTADSQPAGTQPAGTQPVGTQPAGTPSAGTQPAAAKPTEPPPGAKGKPPAADKAKPRELHAAIRKRNIFTPYQTRQHGLALTGVLGNIALFSKGNETIGIEEGKAEGGVKVVSITGYKVTIEFAGKTETMELFSGSPAAPPSGPPGPPPQRMEGPPPAPPAADAARPPGSPPDEGDAEAKLRAASEEALRQTIEARMEGLRTETRGAE